LTVHQWILNSHKYTFREEKDVNVIPSLLAYETKLYYCILYVRYSLQEFYILTIQLIYDNTLKSENRSKCRASLLFF